MRDSAKKQCSYILVRNDFQSWSNNSHPRVQSLPGTLVQLPYPRRSLVFVPEQKKQLHWLLEPPHLDTTATHPAFLLRLSALCSSSWLCIGSIDTFFGPVWAHMGESWFVWWWTVSKVSPPTSQNIKWCVPTTKTYWTRMMFRQVCPMFESNPQQVHVMLVSTLQLMNTDMEKPPFGDHFPRETMGVLYLCEFTQG